VTGVQWDARDRTVFVMCNATEAAAYLYIPVSMTGPSVTQLGVLTIAENGDMITEPVTTPLAANHLPVALVDGQLTVYGASTGLSAVVCATHEALTNLASVTPDRLRVAFAQSIALLRLQDAWEAACRLNDRACWMALSGKAMEVCDVEMAQRVYRRLNDAGMVKALEGIARLEDRASVAGHMALLFSDFDEAQTQLLSSSTPLVALEMRKDLLQWDVAAKLAEALAPDQVPSIMLELGKQQEFKGDHAGALSTFHSVLARLPSAGDIAAAAAIGAPLVSDPAAVEVVRASASAGVARMTIRLGDVRRGMSLALDSGDKALCRECASILEGMKQYPDAATLYRKAELWDKAVALLLQTKNFTAAAPLMDHITTPKLHIMFAKVRTARGEGGGRCCGEAGAAISRWNPPSPPLFMAGQRDGQGVPGGRQGV